ncbi:helix-turn-helix domain-containing protein [Bartonella rattimassiliensis]|uniref:HTH cro/C1-type domain-containing protein n=1 Tax=Bartonella rattimassiliensis 15908 TaxID=1094556 RepID=J0QK37_9HYPH|nr:helix-turn-helix transcriptional regulator [Bartonella rattimassiliensis]EJF83319.1 hypothetical protein MCY_01310 [Bartonella rattimassiliensis 15908]
MAKKEIESKTALAKRLYLIRASLLLSRYLIAVHLGINKAIYDHAERGTIFPNAEFLVVLSHKLKVNLTWLVTGNEMFSDMAKAKVASLKLQAIPVGLMKKLGHLVYMNYRDAKIDMLSEYVVEFAAELYGKL